MEFIAGYCTNAEMRERLYLLFDEVFGISASLLRDFYARGFWDETYRPYTFFEDNRAIANVSTFDLPLLARARNVSAAGIQSVMTHPAYRRQGLMKSLMKTMLSDMDSRVDVSFLFTEQPQLYEPFGFENLPETYFVTGYDHHGSSASGGIRRLDPFEHSITELIRNSLQARVPLSREFSPLRYVSSLFLNMYGEQMRGRLFFLDDLQALIVASVQHDTLALFDVMSPEPVTLDAICRCIPIPFSKVALHFHPDQFPNFKWTPIPHQTNLHLMVRGRVNIPDCLKYPETARF